jgi:glyoxylase-like metal-dependent hydrolase (beta-lactamase superfamily II)
LNRETLVKNAALCATALLVSRIAVGQDAAATLDAAETAMGIKDLSSIQYSGTGSSYFVGQTPAPGGPWVHYTLSRYVADVNYATASMREALDRVQDDGGAPFGGAHQVWLVSGSDAWNDDPSTPSPREPGSRVRSAELRGIEIWLTPPGFIKAAKANKASVKKKGANFVVTFTTADRHKVTGVLNAQHLVERVETAIDNPAVGDLPIGMTFENYQTFGGMKFPAKIIETIGAHPALELTVTSVKPDGAAPIDAPASVRNVRADVVAKSEKVGDGVWYITGGTHHSLLVEFIDHLVVIEAPQEPERSTRVITEIHRLVPGKPIRYVVSTHNDLDHLGGVRTYAAEGASVIAPLADKSYFEKILNAPHTINPDPLTKAGKKVKVEGVESKRVLTDGTQTVELYVMAFSHNVAMLVPYLPKEKLIVQADLQVAPAPGAPAPAAPNPVSLELYNNLQAHKLDVAQIAGIHGRITSWNELLAMAAKSR